ADPAQGAPAATKPAPTAATGPAPDASPPQAADASAGTGAPPPGAGNAGAKDNTDVDVSIGLLKGKNHIRVRGLGTDRNYDSFEQFAHDAPATALFVFLIVTVVFLVPLLIIALLVWYKIRKTRMHNETMLKLAERGVVTPAAAMEALAAGSSPGASFDATADPSTPQAAGGAPLYDQARRMQRRTAWSDLRKGVILTAIGLGLSAFSMFDDGTPNSVGLVLLFLGLGYCVLWFFEDRASGPRRNPPSPPAGGA
ncbi:MAG: hypothetical protein KGR23_15340, partial [Betaproteobacteria bacterium]|nr:hypothetical protein [Betaproteobacteria bacterium]